MMEFKGEGLETKEREQSDKEIHDLIDIIHFTENVSAKIHGILDEAEIYRIVTEDFAKSKRYNVSIILLTDNGSKLGIAETSLIPEKLKSAEKLTGLQLKKYKIDVNKSSIFSQIVREEKTIHITINEIIGEFLPEPLVSLISRFFGYEKKKSILTPLYKKGKIIGAFGMTSTELNEYFIPSVKNLAQHISTALEMADEYAERKKMEESYKHLVELAPDAIVTVNLRGVVTSANEATVKLSGYSKDEIVGKHFSKIGFLRAGDIPKYLKMFSSLIRGKIPQPFELAYIRKDSTIGWVEAHVNLLREGIKEVSVQAILRDITERKKAREESVRLSNAVKMSTDSIVISDLDANIIDVNEATLRMYGTEDKGDLIGKPSIDLIAPEDREKALAGIKQVLEKGYVMGREYHIVIKNGSKIPVEMNSAIMKDVNGNPIGFVGITRDITERKRMEEELRRYSKQLEELVEERTRELKETQKQLLNAERMAAIGETAAMVGHDLRNPLQAITNSVYLLKKSAEKMDSALDDYQKAVDSLPKHLRFKIHRAIEDVVEQRLKLIGIIDKSVNYANKIVSDLQDYARPLKPELVETSLHKLIDDTLSSVMVPENVKVSVMIPEESPKLEVDHELMKRVLVNFVTNALQAMLEGGQLAIEAAKTGEAVSISVQDTGVGIPKENLPKLFHPLFTTKSKGSGFGLAVCKRIVEAHGGSIEVESQVGKGSKFTLEIPIRR